MWRLQVALEEWATTAWTPGCQMSGSASGPGRSAIAIAPAGQASASAASTRPLVARAREEGRATTALPATSADAATTVGTHTGELAACQPSTTP